VLAQFPAKVLAQLPAKILAKLPVKVLALRLFRGGIPAGSSVAGMTANPVPEDRPRAVVLVEGMSDRLALEVLARRRGGDLAAHGVAVIAMHGATNLGHYLERYGPGGLNVQLAGLCDAAEEDYFRRALRRAGIGAGASRAAMEALGFFLCTLDLEDELIRALGTEGVERIIEAEGELRSLRTLQHQPAQRDRSTQDQLRRFMSGRSGNKHRYARLLADTMDLNRVPRPLDGVLAHF
jgi:hypothetical protein